MTRYQKNKEGVRQFAIDWQADFSNQIWQYFKICFPVWAGDMAYCVNFGKMG